MSTVLLWLLINVSDGVYNSGNVTVVARFASARQCEVVHAAIKEISSRVRSNTELRCIQAEVAQ
mgnify:CR=1 FL=1